MPTAESPVSVIRPPAAESIIHELTFPELRRRHEAVLFDAYGVLVNASGALPGAGATIADMRRDGQPFLVVTNDASRSPRRAAERLSRLGIPVEPEHVLSSGMMVGPALQAHGLAEGRIVVLGTDDSAQYVRDIGATVVDPVPDDPADAVVIADEGSIDLIDSLDDILSMILEAHHRGRMPRLILANPDLIYPSGVRRFGFTAGSFAHLVEKALHLLLHEEAPTFEVLGKPSPVHFNAAIELIGTRDVVMLGDTLHTDIAGAQGVGIASAIVLTGVTTRATALAARDVVPTYLLEGLAQA